MAVDGLMTHMDIDKKEHQTSADVTIVLKKGGRYRNGVQIQPQMDANECPKDETQEVLGML